MLPGSSHTSLLRTSCRPAAKPMEHPRVPRGVVGCGMGADEPARGPHADAREAVGARARGAWEIPVIPRAPLRINVPDPSKGTHAATRGRWGEEAEGWRFWWLGPGQAGARRGSAVRPAGGMAVLVNSPPQLVRACDGRPGGGGSIVDPLHVCRRSTSRAPSSSLPAKSPRCRPLRRSSARGKLTKPL
eukprot:2721724-Prymnesium_polylepis.1